MLRLLSAAKKRRPKRSVTLGLEALENRLAMAALNVVGTVNLSADIELTKIGNPNIDGSATIQAQITFLDAGDFTQQSVVDQTAIATGTFSGFLDIARLISIDGTFETDDEPPAMEFVYTTAPLLDIDLVQTGTFEATVNGSPMEGTFVATMDATANFTTRKVSGSVQIELFGPDEFNQSETINFVEQEVVISPDDFDLPVGTLGSVGDRVWFDDNGNGILNTSESGAIGIGVTLFDAVNGVAGDGDDVELGSTLTNDAGFYSFINIPPGDYYLQFDQLLPGQQYTTVNAGTNESVDSDVDPTTLRTEVFAIGVGTHRRDLDAGIRESVRRFQNPLNAYDVDADGNALTFIDLSKLLRDLKINGSRRLDPNRDAAPPPYYDVNGDNRVSPQDVAVFLAELHKFFNNDDPEGESSFLSSRGEAFAEMEIWWLPPAEDAWYVGPTPRSRRK